MDSKKVLMDVLSCCDRLRRAVRNDIVNGKTDMGGYTEIEELEHYCLNRLETMKPGQGIKSVIPDKKLARVGR
jgi:hypothetical protein